MSDGAAERLMRLMSDFCKHIEYCFYGALVSFLSALLIVWDFEGKDVTLARFVYEVLLVALCGFFLYAPIVAFFTFERFKHKKNVIPFSYFFKKWVGYFFVLAFVHFCVVYIFYRSEVGLPLSVSSYISYFVVFVLYFPLIEYLVQDAFWSEEKK